MVTSLRKGMRGFAAQALSLFTMTALAGCHPSGGATHAADKPAPPSKVENATKEADLATVTLTADAETRVGVATAAVVRKPVARTTTYGGEVMVPSGRLTAVTSPFVGTLKPPPGADVTPLPGAAVKRGQPLFVLVPMLSPEAQATMAPLLIESEGQVKQMTEQLNISKLALDRAEKLVKTGAGTAAMLVDAKANYNLAQTNLRAAEARQASLARVAGDVKAGSNKIQIESPASGILQNVHAQAGQTVAAGVPLFEVVSLDPVWIRVPIYVGDAPRLATDRPATVSGLSDSPGAPGERPAKPVVAPPSGDPLAATVNVFYEVSNVDGRLRPGERVGVTLPLKGEDESLAVPRSALIRDIHGGAWVYEKIKPHAYARKRVLVDRVVGDLAVLASGPKAGAEVVSVGAAELYGAEFGGK